MPRLADNLTDTAIRKAKSRAEAYALPDGGGLILQVTPSGTKSWVVRYRLPDGKQRTVAIGDYPGLSLADARVKATEVHLAARTGAPIVGKRARLRAMAAGLDEAERARLAAAEEARKHSFAVMSEAWLASRKAEWAAATYDKSVFIVRKKLQPLIGPLDMRTLASKDVVALLRDIATVTPSIAPKARQCLNGVVEYCILRGIRGDDQVLRLRGALPKHRGGHIPAITKVQGVGPLMRAILGYEGRVVRGGLLLAAYTASRPGIVASAQWEHIDLDLAEWHVPAALMKTRHDHVVSLPRQAVEMLREMRDYGGGVHVFPGVGKRNNPHLHRDALSKALRDLGFRGQHATHGFRAMLRTVAREKLKTDIDVLEAQLAHAKKDEIQAAYDRTRFEDERREVMQVWADFLHEQADGNVLALKTA